ncbi:MAG: hypothetical protein QW534_00385 [Candidatus Methanomethylicia archaeon]
MSIPLSISIIVLAVLFVRFFKRTPFEKAWKRLFLIPPILLSVAILSFITKEIPLGDHVYYSLKLFLIFISLFMFLLSLCSFYQALTYIQPYPGAVIVRLENSKEKYYNGNNDQKRETISISRSVYEVLKRLADERGITVNQFVYNVIVLEWLKWREKALNDLNKGKRKSS